MIRWWTLAATLVASSAVFASYVFERSVWLVYNASESAPRGWYSIERTPSFELGDYVISRLPSTSASLAAARGYIPETVPVLKRIAAVGGQSVCVLDRIVFIDGNAVAVALARDGTGRSLDAWNGCRQLQRNELFLLNSGSGSSFDSRYVGPVDESLVLGGATPLIVWR